MTLITSISGIRGTIGGYSGEALTPVDVVKFTSAYASWIKNENPIATTVIIGRDARVSGDIISQLVSSTLRSMGLNVIDLGLSTTPTVEWAVADAKADGGIILTASHNPAHWNALKLLNAKGEFISAEVGECILNLASKGNFHFAQNLHLGSYTYAPEYLEKHIQSIVEHPLVDIQAIQSRKFKIAVDGCNSTGGIAVPLLLKALGVQSFEVFFDEPNGLFERNPEPLPENLTHISAQMEKGFFDVGIAVDPDVDRLALLCEDGSPFNEEYTLVAVADYVLGKLGGGNTVSNLSSTRALKDVTLRHNGKHFASAVGEVNVVEMMKAEGAVIGGEGNGGVIFPDAHYGRDALIGIALFLSHLAAFKGSTKMLKASYPSYYISKNKIELSPDMNVDLIIEKIALKYQKYSINRVDGLKIEFDTEWVHLRKSNTEPIIRIYSESTSEATAEHLAKKIMQDIRELINE